MCGISGVIVKPGKGVSESVLKAMTDIISHRGPDDSGFQFFSSEGKTWPGESSDHWQVGFGHRRLSIIDLSPRGHQPMNYGSDYWIVFNGEVYNYIELRNELIQEGFLFQTQSDTEVVLAAYVAWGQKSFNRLRGMWGFVILDKIKNQVILCRDRLGIKPLYYTEVDACIVVASEIKQFLKIPGFEPRMNSHVIIEWCQTGYENYNQSFFRDVRVVSPGNYLTVNLENGITSESVPYWNPQVTLTTLSRHEAGVAFRSKFEDSVKVHLRSDVPVACALSGGLDSSTVAMVMNTLNPSAFHTFSTVFSGHKLNEQPYINEVLSRINAVPHFNTPSSSDFSRHAKDFIWHNDEPPVAFSPFASFLLAKNVQQEGVKVTLNGQGGDEVLGGYWQNYLAFLRASLKNLNLTEFLKHTAGSLLPNGNPGLISQMFYYASRIRNKRNFQIPWISLSDSYMGSNFLNQYLTLNSNERRLFELRYLILPKLLKYDDRNTMAFSVEGRYPFLDHELIEFCLSLPPDALYNRGWTKQPIRNGFKDLLPPAVARRKSKWGYPVPQVEWIQELKDYFVNWVDNKSRPIWELVPQQYVKDMFHQILTGKKANQEVFVRLHFLDLWLEIFTIKHD
ncbi:MAG: asparagine synthase (glutamine-hydrolyzing) [Cyclobacteriaceae bacterium]|nr:asparagine synthase (glutamine-hydrolyzing) [Cyclobacteriaceae bacterium]